MSDFYFRTTPARDHRQPHRGPPGGRDPGHAPAGEGRQASTSRPSTRTTPSTWSTRTTRRASRSSERIEDKYPHYRLQSYRTLRKARGLQHLRMYVVYRPQYRRPDKAGPDETDIRKIADKTFLASVPKETIDRYQSAPREGQGLGEPAHRRHPRPQGQGAPDLGRHQDATPARASSPTSRTSSIPTASSPTGNTSSTSPTAGRSTPSTSTRSRATSKLQDLIEDISLIYVIPESPLSALFREGKLTAQEIRLRRLRLELRPPVPERLQRGIPQARRRPQGLARAPGHPPRPQDQAGQGHLHGIARLGGPRRQLRLHQEALRPLRPEVQPGHQGPATSRPSWPPSRRTSSATSRSRSTGASSWPSSCSSTPSSRRTSTSRKRRPSPSCTTRTSSNKVDYPVTPFGIFHVIGGEFRGFHIRFRDIARGGIRIVRSANLQTYLNNSDLIFDENYNLASTQQRKNKDIPDGGSKGTILLHWGFQDRPEAAFKKYVDGLLDLMLPEPGVVDYYGKEVILFLGPDEGTADLMEWAALRAKAPRLQVLEGLHDRQAGRPWAASPTTSTA